MYLVDTSVMARVAVPQIGDLLTALIDDGVACTCITVDLAAGYSARGAEDIKKINDTRASLFRYLPVTAEAEQRARRAQILMAERGLHRAAGAMDLLTAAIAEQHRATMLHYDADFEHIASVTGQQHRWVVPRGSID
jgi:hypothetical protein